MKKLIFMLLALFLIKNTQAQKWQQMILENKNFYDIQKEFNNYFKDKNTTEKGNGYKLFKRWEHFVEPRVSPSGDLSLLSLTARNFQKFLDDNSTKSAKGGNNNMIASTTWTAMGPFGALTFTDAPQYVLAGRCDFLRVDPNNNNVLYTGSPTGGLWKSTNAGTSWTTTTNNLAVTGCADIAIDPGNSNILYLATGDGNTVYSNSIGVLKSTDGGITWNATGLTYTVTGGQHILRLLIDPSNSQMLLAATNLGIYKTTNGGTTWAMVSPVVLKDMEFKPGNSNVVYASGYYGFYLSTDNGASFTLITNGIPSTNIGGISIAVTPADPTYVYAIITSTNGGTQGFYQSNTSGVSFTAIGTPSNILGYSLNGTGGQGSYNLCISASPINKNVVIVGGIYPYYTVNAGGSWTSLTSVSTPTYIHGDQHDIVYSPSGSSIYIANDGGLHQYSGGTISNVTGNMNVAQIYKLGLSSMTPNVWLTGLQDNGTSIHNNTNYSFVLGADGTDGFIDRTNDNNIFAGIQYGGYFKSTDGGATFSQCDFGITGTPGWVSPWKQDPLVANRLYAGYTDLWISNNLASTWTSLSAIPASGTIIEFAIAPSNNQVIYVIKDASICKTINGGTSWTNITGTLPLGGFTNPTYVAIDPTDANNVWITVSDYSAGNKVFVTTNGGTTWTNVSYNLPNIPANCILYQPGTNDRVFVGMDAGVYYMDNSMTSWILYNAGLPNVAVSELQLSPVALNKLVASTYGRGVYEVDIPASPSSSFSVNSLALCSGQDVQFTDVSLGSPNGWSWSVTPSAGVTITNSNSQNPLINFSNIGNYTVSLIASNGFGAGNLVSQFITVNQTPSLVVYNSAQTVCVGSAVIFSVSGTPSYTWSNGGGNNSLAIYTPTTQSTYTVYGQGINGCIASGTVSVELDPCVGIKDLNAAANVFKVSPNPNKGNFTLEISSDADINVYSTLGNLVLSKKVKVGKNNIDLGNLSNGIYYLQAVVNKRTSVIKIIKEE